MALSNVAVGDAILATLLNSLIAHANGTPGRAVFTANGVWSVPAGVHQFKVYLCGGGGAAGAAYYQSAGEGEMLYRSPGGAGGDSPLCSKIISGQAIGTSFAITIGAAPGGTSTFGTLLSSSGGGTGGNGSSGGGEGASGAHNGTMRHGNDMFQAAPKRGYGSGGRGMIELYSSEEGMPGICVIEW